ncbi:MAG: hypothetical protein IJQ11_09605 [Bacteroidales bacterium]|nr:hypothetical protein [Bacteroidales bacterium]
MAGVFCFLRYNCTNPDGLLYAHIMKNNGIYLNNPSNEGRWIPVGETDGDSFIRVATY